MPTGVIKFFNRRKGFGFIKYDDSEKEIFVHATGMVDKKEIQENDKVEFDEKDGDKGLAAFNVRKTNSL
jgi:cold shock protein